MWARLVNIALGLWLMAAPAVLGYGDPAAANDRIVGPLAVAFATIAIWEATRAVRFVNVLLSVWLIISPLVLGYGSVAAVNSIVVGVALGLLAFVRGKIKQTFGGGWSALWRSSDEG